MASADIGLGDSSAASAPVGSALTAASARGGYAWWYIEAHDTATQRFGLTLILFAGAVFSPDYAERLRRGERRHGLQHPAVNFALYERPSRRRRFGSRSWQRLWVMSEYPSERLSTSDRRLTIGDSSIDYATDGTIRVELREPCTRFFGRPGAPLEAQITITPTLPALASAVELGRGDDGAVHYWQPLATAAAATVALRCGELEVSYRGVAYADRNFGSGRLEDTFRRWSWAHGVAEAAEPAQSSSLVLYRAERCDGGLTQVAVQSAGSHPPTLSTFSSAGDERLEAAAQARPESYLWLAVPSRFTVGPSSCERLPDGRLEDTPFYARYLARLHDSGGSYLGVGEYLDLERFTRPWVQRLLPYKTRRVVP